MLTVKVEKSEHGGYIAKQEGDSPLRYIAAAGDTEAAAVAALFDYHADLIRKGRIDTKEVKRGLRPGDTRHNSFKLDAEFLEEYPFHDIIPGHLWDYLMPSVKGTGSERPPPEEQINNLICRVIRRPTHFVASEPSKRFCFTGESFNWVKLALSIRNQRPDVKQTRWFKTEDDVLEESEALARMSAQVLWNLRQDMGIPNIKYIESEIADFIECCIKAFGGQGIEFNACVLPNQYLLTMLDMECVEEATRKSKS